jgi:hypothetical protein
MVFLDFFLKFAGQLSSMISVAFVKNFGMVWLISKAQMIHLIITLIPKDLSPEGPNDYMPISLLNICLNLITKILANRLQSRILQLVHVNQYGFLHSRNIQDCVRWAYEYIHQCKQIGTKIAILKLDFAKAFDIVDHIIIMKVFECMGFDDRWLMW